MPDINEVVKEMIEREKPLRSSDGRMSDPQGDRKLREFITRSRNPSPTTPKDNELLEERF